MADDEAPPTTRDAPLERRAERRRLVRTGCAVVCAGIAIALGLLLLVWRLVAPGGPMHAAVLGR